VGVGGESSSFTSGSPRRTAVAGRGLVVGARARGGSDEGPGRPRGQRSTTDY